MEALEFRAYEVLGYWTLVVIRVWQHEDGRIERDLIYKGDHLPIDETDPVMRAVLLFARVQEDLDWALRQDAALPVVGA